MEDVTALPLFTVVIPTQGTHDILWQTLDCLHRTDLSQAEVIVVFNGLPQNRERVENGLASRFPSVRCVCTPEPYGIARANNLGARAGQGQFVAFLHDDVLIFEFGWLAQLSDLLNRRPEVGLVGGSEPKDIDRSGKTLGEIEPGVIECDGSPTVSIARRSDLATCAFDEFYSAGLEDKDWALAFRRRGLKVVCRKIPHTHVGTKGASSLLLSGRRKTWWMKLCTHSFFVRLGQKAPSALAASMNGLAFVLPLSIALSNVLWGLSLLLWGVTLVTNRPRYRWTGLELPYLVGLGIAVVTTLASAHPLHGLHSLRSEILVVVFVLAAQTGNGVALRKRLVFFSIGAMLAGGWGILQWAIGFEWNSLLGMGALPEKLRGLPSGLVRLFSLHAGRAQGFYNHPITFAEMLLLSGALILGSWLVERRPFWLVAGALVGGAILLSQTRSVWMAMFLMLGAWVFLRREKNVLAAALILVAVFGLCLGGSSTLRGRAASIVDTQRNGSNLIRMGLWNKSLDLIRENPVRGIGSGNFSVKGAELRWGGCPPETKWTEAHSIYLQNAVERGLPGFLVFLWFLLAIGKKLWEAAKSTPIGWGIFFGFFGLLISGLTETWTNDSEVVLCVYFLIGTAWALGKSPGQSLHSPLESNKIQ